MSGNGIMRAVAVPLLNPTFGRCAENPENRLTFGRWERGKAGQRERRQAQCVLRNVSNAVKYSSVWVNAAWRCLQSNSRRVTSGEAVRGSSRRRGLTVSSVAWISSMGTESPGGKTGSNSICGEDGYSQIVFLKILKFLRILYFYRK